ncbi:hypothetical protein [Roseateles sp. L2-2]|uniref:hypothetical protein n=1 Tax=Roseateles sp. L2-2 TaxID=3422597 RepID=UPI003D35DB66
MVDEAIRILDENPSIHRLWLIDVPGGFGVPAARLASRAQELDVYVAGGCYSACAEVALSGRVLHVVPWRDGRLASALIIHGAFAMNTGEWVAQGLNNLARYAERLDPISRADIEAALRFPSPTAAGLFIFTDKSVRDAKGQTVLLCEYFPSKCRSIDVTREQIHIARSDLPVPPELPPDDDVDQGK